MRVSIFSQGKRGSLVQESIAAYLSSQRIDTYVASHASHAADGSTYRELDRLVSDADAAIALLTEDRRHASSAGNLWLEIGMWLGRKSRQSLLLCQEGRHRADVPQFLRIRPTHVFDNPSDLHAPIRAFLDQLYTRAAESLVFDVAGHWSAADIYRFFHSLNVLYNRVYVTSQFRTYDGIEYGKLIGTAHARVPKQDRLTIDGLLMRSPGTFSFLGLEKIVREIRELIKDLSYRNREEQSMLRENAAYRRERASLDIARRRTTLLEEQIQVLREANVPEEVIQENIPRLLDPGVQLVMIMEKRGAVVRGEEEQLP